MPTARMAALARVRNGEDNARRVCSVCARLDGLDVLNHSGQRNSSKFLTVVIRATVNMILLFSDGHIITVLRAEQRKTTLPFAFVDDHNDAYPVQIIVQPLSYHWQVLVESPNTLSV